MMGIAASSPYVDPRLVQRTARCTVPLVAVRIGDLAAHHDYSLQ
jgi:hypothetical protein